MAYVDNHLQRMSSYEQAEERPALTEPVIVQTEFLTGCAIETKDTIVRLVGLEEVPKLPGEPAERRIVTRLVMSNNTAREIARLLRDSLTNGGH